MPIQRRNTVGRELRRIARALGSIQASLGRVVPMLDAARQVAPGPTAPRKLNLSPERKAALKVQGQYMGYLRGLKPRQKTQVKALAARRGMKAAVVLARKLAGK